MKNGETANKSDLAAIFNIGCPLCGADNGQVIKSKLMQQFLSIKNLRINIKNQKRR